MYSNAAVEADRTRRRRAITAPAFWRNFSTATIAVPHCHVLAKSSWQCSGTGCVLAIKSRESASGTLVSQEILNFLLCIVLESRLRQMTGNRSSKSLRLFDRKLFLPVRLAQLHNQSFQLMPGGRTYHISGRSPLYIQKPGYNVWIAFRWKPTSYVLRPSTGSSLWW